MEETHIKSFIPKHRIARRKFDKSKLKAFSTQHGLFCLKETWVFKITPKSVIIFSLNLSAYDSLRIPTYSVTFETEINHSGLRMTSNTLSSYRKQIITSKNLLIHHKTPHRLIGSSQGQKYILLRCIKVLYYWMRYLVKFYLELSFLKQFITCESISLNLTLSELYDNIRVHIFSLFCRKSKFK